jgi:hypothetical protein
MFTYEGSAKGGASNDYNDKASVREEEEEEEE